MSRDWQKDMEICKQSKADSFSDGLSFLSILPDIGIHWLQEFAKWKAKASEAEVKAHQEKVRADKAEEESEQIQYQYENLLDHSLNQKFKLAEEKDRADKAELAYQGLAEECINMGEYQLLQKHTDLAKAYRAEKERADKAEERVNRLIGSNQRYQIKLAEMARKEERLRKAIETAINNIDNEAFRTACNGLEEVLASLYPDKEEDK